VSNTFLKNRVHRLVFGSLLAISTSLGFFARDTSEAYSNSHISISSKVVSLD